MFRFALSRQSTVPRSLSLSLSQRFCTIGQLLERASESATNRERNSDVQLLRSFVQALRKERESKRERRSNNKGRVDVNGVADAAARIAQAHTPPLSLTPLYLALIPHASSLGHALSIVAPHSQLPPTPQPQPPAPSILAALLRLPATSVDQVESVWASWASDPELQASLQSPHALAAHAARVVALARLDAIGPATVALRELQAVARSTLDPTTLDHNETGAIASLVVALGRNGDQDAATSLATVTVKRLMAHGHVPPAGLVTSLFSVACAGVRPQDSGQVDTVLRLFDTLSSSWPSSLPDSRALFALVRALGRIGREDEALSLVEREVVRGHAPTGSVFGALAGAYAERGDWAAARRVTDWAVDCGRGSDPGVYIAVLDVFHREQRESGAARRAPQHRGEEAPHAAILDAAHALASSTTAGASSPRFISTLVQALAQARRAHAAWTVLSQAHADGVALTTSHPFVALLHAWRRRHLAIEGAIDKSTGPPPSLPYSPRDVVDLALSCAPLVTPDRHLYATYLKCVAAAGEASKVRAGEREAREAGVRLSDLLVREALFVAALNASPGEREEERARSGNGALAPEWEDDEALDGPTVATSLTNQGLGRSVSAVHSVFRRLGVAGADATELEETAAVFGGPAALPVQTLHLTARLLTKEETVDVGVWLAGAGEKGKRVRDLLGV